MHSSGIIRSMCACVNISFYAQLDKEGSQCNSAWHPPREWPYPEEEKKANKRGFGQYKSLKGHKHEKEQAIRFPSHQ